MRSAAMQEMAGRWDGRSGESKKGGGTHAVCELTAARFRLQTGASPLASVADTRAGSLHLCTTASHCRFGNVGAAVLGTLFQAERLAVQLQLPAEQAADSSALLLHAFRRGGDRFIEHLHGEFCFVLWDDDRERLLLGRDSSGSYPLFFSRSGDVLSFASDLRLLGGASGIRLRVDERRVAQWLALLPPDPGSTFFQGIVAVPAGAVLSFDGSCIRTVSHWDPTSLSIRRGTSFQQDVDELRWVLAEAVRDRISPGQAVATTLSGGLDSSSITALAAGHLLSSNSQMAAFTAVPREPIADPAGHFGDEWSRAAAVARCFPNIRHVPVRHGSHAAFDVIDRFNAAEMQPIFNPANYDWLLQTCLCAAAAGSETLHMGLAGNLTVSYDGHGALPSLLRRGGVAQAARLGYRMHQRAGTRWRAVLHQAFGPFLPSALSRELDRWRGAGLALDCYSLIAKTFAQEHGFGPAPRQQRGSAADPRVARLASLQRIDPGPTLHAFRRLTGVHIADATNDRRVVEFCFSVREERFCEGGVPRNLLREAMRNLLPTAVRTERLRGLQSSDFGIRFQAELPQARLDLQEMEALPELRRILDLAAMRRMLDEAHTQTGSGSQIHFWPKLLRALSLGRFLRSIEAAP